MNGHCLVSYLEQCDDKIYYQQLDLEKNQSKTKKTQVNDGYIKNLPFFCGELNPNTQTVF